MPSDIKKLVGTLTTVTKKIAAGSSVVEYGIVLSRNPDGTLNVDLGNGGCAIVAPSSNARVGDRILIGATPPIGTITSLTPQGTNLPGEPICPPGPPGDPLAGIGNLCAVMINQIRDWGLRDTTYTYDGSFPFSHSAGSTHVSGLQSQISSRADALLYYEFGGSFPPTPVWGCYRYFVRFKMPTNGVITGLAFEMSIDSGANDNTQNGRRWAPDNDTMMVLPAFPSTWPPTITDWNSIAQTKYAGSIPIMDASINTFGTTSYGVHVPLDVKVLNQFNSITSGWVYVCIVSGFDFFGATPPHNTTIPSAHGGVFGPDGYGDQRANWIFGYAPPLSPPPTANEFPRLIGTSIKT